MKLKYCIPVLVMLLKIYAGHSQGFTCPAGVMISHAHAKGGLMFTYTYMDMMMKDNLSGSRKISDEEIWNQYLYAPQKMHMGMHMLMGMYGLSERVSLMLMGEYRSSSMTMALPPGTMLGHHHGDSTQLATMNTVHQHASSGFGDTKLWVIYKLFEHEHSTMVLSAGLNIPTGRINLEAGEHALYEGQRESYMMQLGTGTLDIMPGITYVKHGGQLTWSVQALSTLRPFYNGEGYHYGNDVTLNTWASYLLTPSMSLTARLEGYTGAAISGYDQHIYAITEPGADPSCYGGQRLSAFGGLNFYLAKGWLNHAKLAFEFGAPFWQNVNGIQQVNHFCWNASITKAL